MKRNRPYGLGILNWILIVHSLCYDIAMSRLPKILTFLFLFLFIVGLTIFMSVSTYTSDDWWTCIYRGNLWKTFLIADQGQVWSWFGMKFVTNFFPALLHTHPQQNIILQIIRALNFAIVFYLASSFFNLSKKEVPHCFTVVVNSLCLFIPIIMASATVLIFVNHHYKYLFILMIGIAIWNIWFREFLNDEFLKKNKILRDIIFAVILAFCGHIVSIPSLFIMIFLLLYKIKISGNNPLKSIKSIFMSSGIVFLYSELMYIDFNLPGFKYIKDSERSVAEPVLYFITHFLNYTKELFVYIFTHRYLCPIFIITLIGLALLLIFRKKTDIKYIVISFAIFISVFIFEYSLLICGRTYYDHKSYWFISGEVTYTLNFYLILICNVVYGCLFRLLNKKWLKMIFCAFCLLIISLIYPVKDVYNTLKTLHDKLLEQRIGIYKLNKLFAYYSLQNGDIYIPHSYYWSTNQIYKWIPVSAINDNMKNTYKIDSKREIFEVEKEIINEDKFFEDRELENIDFNRLYDKEFILKTEAPKFE